MFGLFSWRIRGRFFPSNISFNMRVVSEGGASVLLDRSSKFLVFFVVMLLVAALLLSGLVHAILQLSHHWRLKLGSAFGGRNDPGIIFWRQALSAPGGHRNIPKDHVISKLSSEGNGYCRSLGQFAAKHQFETNTGGQCQPFQRLVQHYRYRCNI